MNQADLDKWATWRELNHQPEIWRKWADCFNLQAMVNWINGLNVSEIWLSGAGSSAYIGDIIASGLHGHSQPRILALASTDIVSRPHTFLRPAPALIINFGRSGDSRETIGVLDALDQLNPKMPRLNITCNREGALALRDSQGPQNLILLPDDSHDSGFAMTASFSTMLLTALGLLDPEADFNTVMKGLADAFDGLKQQVLSDMPEQPARIVFLGAGALTHAAREAALKVMELSAGRIPALWDSPLGFRHGPKSFMNDRTLVCLFTSGDAHARRYETDLALELRQQFPDARMMTVGPDAELNMPLIGHDAWRAPLYIAVAQIMAVIWSDALGLNVDNPFENQGTLTRVVSNFRLHPIASLA